MKKNQIPASSTHSGKCWYKEAWSWTCWIRKCGENRIKLLKMLGKASLKTQNGMPTFQQPHIIWCISFISFLSFCADFPPVSFFFFFPFSFSPPHSLVPHPEPLEPLSFKVGVTECTHKANSHAHSQSHYTTQNSWMSKRRTFVAYHTSGSKEKSTVLAAL